MVVRVADRSPAKGREEIEALDDRDHVKNPFRPSSPVCVEERGDVGENFEDIKVFGPKNAILDIELAARILVPTVNELLTGSDALALAITCNTIHSSVMTASGALMVPHISQEAIPRALRGEIDPLFVQSLTVNSVPSGSHDPQPLQTGIFKNCRSILWKPKDWKNTPRGQFIESESCSIQGIKDIYFRLYPNGKEYSRVGRCAMFFGSCGSVKNVSIRLRIGKKSHILTQRLHHAYVDGFVNFCDIEDALFSHDEMICGLDVLVGPNDSDFDDMNVDIGPGNRVTWTIPGTMNTYLHSFSCGDRIISDVFSIPGLGRDSCFVIYPKGDTVDVISGIGNFVNVGLFGSSNKDVTFRLSAGSVSKVLTACSERYRSKTNNGTKSCGEFFDACFAELPDMLTGDQMRLKLEVLDTEATQTMEAHEGTIYWKLCNIQNLVRILGPYEDLYSRYFTMVPWESQDDSSVIDLQQVFFRFQARFIAEGQVLLTLAGLNHKKSCCSAIVEMTCTTQNGARSETQRVSLRWRGLSNTVSRTIEIPEPESGDIWFEMKLLHFEQVDFRVSRTM